MRIGLISDTHIPEAMPELYPQVLKAFNGVECILHGGDIHELFVLDQLATVAPVYCARGNGEDGSGGRDVQPDDERLRETWILPMGGLTIGLTHAVAVPESPPYHTMARTFERLFPDGKPDVLIYGDTHVEHIATFEDVLCINPGSPTYPHNLEAQFGTIGFLDIENGQATPTIWQITDHGIEPFEWGRWGLPW